MSTSPKRARRSNPTRALSRFTCLVPAQIVVVAFACQANQPPREL